jgi:outer membrane protein TolC
MLKRQEELATYMLKFQLGLLPEDSLVLKTTLSEIISKTNLSILQDEFNLNKNPTYQLMNTQVAISNLGYKQQISKTLPSLVGVYSYSEKSMKDSLNFFKDGTEWFPTSLVGLTLKVPIFSSGQRLATIQQSRIDYEISQNNKQMLEQTLNIQYIQAKNDYMNAYENLLNQEQSMKLSEKVYNETQIKFKQGSSSSFDLTQAQNQYLQSEATYYQALIQLLNAKTSLEKLLNY